MATATHERAIVSASVAAEERQALARLAQDADRSLSAEIRRALREYLERSDEQGERG